MEAKLDQQLCARLLASGVKKELQKERRSWKRRTQLWRQKCSHCKHTRVKHSKISENYSMDLVSKQTRMMNHVKDLNHHALRASARLLDHNCLNSKVSQLLTNAKTQDLGLLNVSRSMLRAPAMWTTKLAEVLPIIRRFYHRRMCKKMLLQTSRCKQVKQGQYSKNSFFMAANTEVIKPFTTARSLKFWTYIINDVEQS